MSSKQEFPLVADAGIQFGHQFYQCLMDFSQMGNFFRIFGDVQRSEDQRHAKRISEYVLDILERGTIGIVPTITVNARGPVRYDSSERKLYMDYKTVLSVNDGQHRFLAVTRAIEFLRGQIERMENLDVKKAKKTLDEIAIQIEVYREQLQELENMSMSLFILDNLTEEEERQIFTDINKNSKKVNKSKALMYDYRDPYAKVAHEVVDQWEVPEFIEVMSDQDKLGEHDTEFILFSTVVKMVKSLTGKRDISDVTVADDVLGKTLTLFKHLTKNLPADIAARDKYILANSITMQAVARQASVWAAVPGVDFESTVAQLADMDWTHYAWNVEGLLWDASNNRVIFKGSSAIKVMQEILGDRLKVMYVPSVRTIYIPEKGETVPEVQDITDDLEDSTEEELVGLLEGTEDMAEETA